MLNWHKKKCEEIRELLGLSHYQLYWISFIKGVIIGALIIFIYNK